MYSLFNNDTKIYNHIASEISVRSVIAGIIANEVEIQKGTEGILKFINAGREDRILNFIKATNQLIGLNENNFNKEVSRLLLDF